ncbi:MAG: hypothetical protein NTW30_05895 [Candidatus Aenigmarchaeota archaeon]|nr:hypothetical protein [Candidatus Aenigmarchaeota archaeon]
MSERPLCKDCNRQKNPDKIICVASKNREITKKECLTKRKELKGRKKS